jgi:hypothetical protein
MLEHYRDLADQLATLPGGSANLRGDYFATVTLPEAPADAAARLKAALGEGHVPAEAWALAPSGLLALAESSDGTAQLVWLKEDGAAAVILDYPPGLAETAREYGIPPLGLALLVQAMGTADDERRLRRLLPAVDKAAKGLLLIASCRLCG